MPGVSIRITCAPGRLAIPRMRLRVVCGAGATMETFSATQAFVSVLLPAFGRPTMATNPHLNDSASGIGKSQISNLKFLMACVAFPQFRAFPAGSSQAHSSRPGPSHDRNPKDAEAHEASTAESPWVENDLPFEHCAAVSTEMMTSPRKSERFSP